MTNRLLQNCHSQTCVLRETFVERDHFVAARDSECGQSRREEVVRDSHRHIAHQPKKRDDRQTHRSVPDHAMLGS